MAFTKSFKYAWHGLLSVYRDERNFRVECLAAIAALLGGVLFSFSFVEFAIVTVVIALVLSLEILNSAMERYLDVVEVRMKTYVRLIKDMLAGAVFVGSLGAFLVGIFLYLPHLIILLRNSLF